MVRHRLLLIEARGDRFLGTVGATPVRENKTLETPVLLHRLAQKGRVLTAISAVEAVIGAHHGTRLSDPEADLESEQITLLHGALGDNGIDDVASGFLVVYRKVLDITNDMLGLLTLHQVSDHR